MAGRYAILRDDPHDPVVLVGNDDGRTKVVQRAGLHKYRDGSVPVVRVPWAESRGRLSWTYPHVISRERIGNGPALRITWDIVSMAPVEVGGVKVVVGWGRVTRAWFVVE